MSIQVPSLNLPPVIQSYPDVISLTQSQVDAAKLPNKPKIIIIYSKNIDDDIPLISQYGKVVKMNDSLLNTDISKLQCDYLLCDANNKVYLANVERFMGQDGIQFSHYGYFFEVDFYDDINCITKFKQCKDSNDFNDSLLNEKKLSSPNKIVNCLSFLVNFLASLKK